MPCITVLPSHAAREPSTELLAQITRQAAVALGKSEAVMMVRAEPRSTMLFGGSDEPCAALVVRTGGPPSRAQREACLTVLTALATEHLGVGADRCFVIFEPVARDHWGVRGQLLE